MTKKNLPVSGSGSPIYLHKEKDLQFKAVQNFDDEAKGIFEEHIEKYIGPIHTVLHEVISHLIHLDIYHIQPNEDRPYHTFITHGMSDLAMNTPEGAEDFQYAELICFLPKEWDVTEEGFEKEENYWVIENLKFLARMPHEFDTWLGFGHTIQNGNPIVPFTSDTKLCASLLLPPIMTDHQFASCDIRENKKIHIYNVMPIYLEEMKFKMKKGIDPFLDRLDQYQISEIYDLQRVNTCQKKWFLF